MGKNRKAKQVVNQAHVDSEDDGLGRADVPAEFLTSDDFQVVHKKRHHSSKKSLDDQPSEGFNSLPRSRSYSERNYTDSKDLHGCHSGFWTTRNHQSSEDIEGVVAGAMNCNGNHHVLKAIHSNGCLSTPADDLDACSHMEPKLCSKVRAVEREDSLEVDEGVLTGFKKDCLLADEDGVTSVQVSLEIEKIAAAKVNDGKVDLNQQVVAVDDHLVMGKSKTDERNNSKDKIEHESVKDDVRITTVNGNTSSDGCSMKSNSQKKKDKKVRDKQKKVDKFDTNSRIRTSSRNFELQRLVSSSSSEFSEMTSSAADDEMESKSIDETGPRGDRKRPSKKQLAAIHEALRRAKEEEERRKQEEEAKKRMAEEAERMEQERLRLEQEKKEKKKLKEKQKREKLKAEGKLLSKSQKLSRARMVATLEAFRQQGVDVPQIGEKRPRGPRLGNYKPSNRKRLDSSQSDAGVGKSERYKSESISSQESSGKESLSDLPSSFESKDSWIMDTVLDAARISEDHFSCSEESDALCEDRSSNNEKVNASAKLIEPVAKAKFNGDGNQASVLEDKKDSVRLRSPVICVLGHVDTGKTKLLDFIRKTHVQDSEAGGITQQIGATMIPQVALKEKCKMVKIFSSFEIKVPGLLVIDTPGHESFRNLRSRGSSICDIAILVVDIMHGLEPQTLESINLLKRDKIPFIVALNKVDRLFGWKTMKDEDIESVINKQSTATLMEFKTRCQEIVLQFAKECLNSTLYYENKDPRTYVSMVPVSAVTGDGMGNLLSLIMQLTQTLMHKKLVFSHELQATVLEVKAIPGLGTTIDVILVNGRLQEGDTILLASHEGPFVTQIRSLLMPQPLKELRVKNPYIEYKAIEGAQGLKITGKDLDKTLAGLPLYVTSPTNLPKTDELKSQMSDLLEQSTNYIKTSERGVYVQASTLGSLEALLEYLTVGGIPYFGVKIGPVVKKDVMKASIMLEHDVQYAAILAFDVKVERDAQELADSLGVKVFHANIIYHLFDEFLLYREEVLKKRSHVSHDMVYPCILKILPRDENTPKELLRVKVEAGTLHENTPLCVPTKGNLEVGMVTSVSGRHFSVGEEALIGLACPPGGVLKVFGVDFDQEDYLVSRITKQSIEVCKEYFRHELEQEDWHLINVLKKMLHIHV